MDSKPNPEHVRHSLAHLLAAAVINLNPQALPTIGPAIENGFYYDFDFRNSVRPDEHQFPDVLKAYEEEMKRLLPSWTEFTHREVSARDAREIFKNNPFKIELINDLEKEGQKITLYTCGGFTDLCRGGHVTNPAKEIPKGSFKLDKLAGAYWRGDEKNPQLTRIYGLAFSTKQELDDYLGMRAEAEKRDHKKLGPQLDLFTFSDLVGPGLPLWTPKGTLIRNLLDDFVWKLRAARGYLQVDIPHITKKDLYEKSGHWDKFKNELFRITTREGHEFAMKPMNCPHHTQIYARRQWSYRELPQRYASTTKVYRDEQSGELAGLARVLAITQDDAHVFCRMTQAKEEFLKIWDIVQEFYSAFGFSLRVRVSLHDPEHPEKYLGDKAKWKLAENMLREIVHEKKADSYDGLGEAAFYGPKLDFMGKDAIGRLHQVATIQLDVNMPERFDLFCINEKGEQERIVMIHAAIMGSIERFLSVIIEHFAGAFPLWLAPTQVVVLPISDKFSTYGKSVHDALTVHGLRSELVDTNESLGKRIRAAEVMKVPYVVVVGEKEENANTVNFRTRGSKEKTTEMKLDGFMKKLKEEMDEKTL